MTEKFRTIEVLQEKNIATVWLNRPEVHNAFNALMISELSRAIRGLAEDKSVRVVIIRGRGKSFCSGADIKWMKGGAGLSPGDNYREAKLLSDFFRLVYSFPRPLITVVHGHSNGGANGMVAASDIAICSDDTVFSLSETKIGLVPSVIAPYVIKRIGEFRARELMLTAGRIFGTEAEQLGLVNRSCQLRELDQVLEEITGQLMEGGPEALVTCKKLILDICNSVPADDPDGYTAELLARIRVSEEGQEGMAAFIEKRKPVWTGSGNSETGHIVKPHNQ